MYRIIFVGLLSVFHFNCTPNSAIGSGADILVGDKVEQIENSVSSIIGEAEGAISRQSFAMSQKLELLLDKIKLHSKDIMNHAFDKISITEQKMYNDILNVMNEAESMTEIPLQKIEDLTRSSSLTLATLPFSKTTPLVDKYSPLYVNSFCRSDSILVNVKGTFLNKMLPTLTFSNTKCILNSKLATSLQFKCPCSLVKDKKINESVHGALIVFEEEKHRWNPFKKPEFIPHDYLINLNVIPNEFATYKVNIVESVKNKAVPIKRTSQILSHWNNKSESNSKVNKNDIKVTATPGYRINPNNIKIQHIKSPGKSSRVKIQDNTAAGFILVGFTQNRKGFLGHGRARGHVDSRAIYYETIIEPGVTITPPRTISNGTLQWGKDVKLRIPPNTKSFDITFDLVDGNSDIFDTSSNEDWFDLRYNEESKLLIIDAKKLDDALK